MILKAPAGCSGPASGAPAGCSGPASVCPRDVVGLLAGAFLKMEFLEELFNMALAMKGNELA